MEHQVTKVIDELQKKFRKSQYSKFMKGKRVVIVGPDTNLLGSKKGEDIEHSDIIIRINTAYDFMPFKNNLVIDIGRRTDVLYQCPSSFKKLANTNGEQTRKKLHLNKTHFICYQNGNQDGIYFNKPYLYPNLERRLKIILNRSDTRLHYSHLGCLKLTQILSLIGEKMVVPRTGLLAIWDCLVHGAKTVRVEGMSFYNGGGHMFRKIKGPLQPTKDHNGSKSNHDSTVEMHLFNILRTIYHDRIHYSTNTVLS